MPKLRAIVFDLDDTLYCERDYVVGGFRAVAAWAAKRLTTSPAEGFSELCCLFDHGARGDTFDRWLQSHGIKSDRWVRDMVRIYREHEPRIVPYPEVVPLLRRLHQWYCLGLVSDGYLEVQKKKLAALGLDRCFDAVVFSDELGRKAWKPSSRPFEIVLDRLGATGPAAVYVADNPVKDFVGARRAGMWTVRVRRPGSLYGDLQPPSREHAPTKEIRTLNDLEELLKDIAEQG